MPRESSLAIGGCTVDELRNRMLAEEERDWRRFFMIYGPAGDQRLDMQFAYLRWIIASQSGDKRPIADHMLKFDYRDRFPKDAVTEIGRMIENVDADIAKVMALGSRLKRSQESGVRRSASSRRQRHSPSECS
jgi:hypothetical protein